MSDDWQQAENGYSYGLYGTPAVLELAARIADLENARHTFIVPGDRLRLRLSTWPFAEPAATL